MSQLTPAKKFALKYTTNPEFRKRHIQYVKEYKQKKATEKKKQKAQLKFDRKQWRVINVSGKMTECCRITFLASALGRKANRVREWEDEERIPKTIRVNGQRYYTRKHYNMIIRYWNKYQKDLDSFFAKVWGDWNNCYR